MFPKVVYTDDVTVINAQNLNDIQDAIIRHEDKADPDGYYEDMTVGMAEELVGTTFTEDDTPYQIRKSGGGVEVGAREYLNRLVGGSLGWNQMIPHTSSTGTSAGITFTNNNDGSWTLTGTGSSANAFVNLNYVNSTTNCFVPNHIYYATVNKSGSTTLSTIGMLLSGAASDGIYVYSSRIFKAASTLDARGWARLQVTNATNIDIGTVKLWPQIFDLTQMFGDTIADYIYQLENSSSGSGIAWLRKYIDIDSYHAYDAGSIQNVQATEHVTTGFNQFDEVVEAGYWNVSTGQKASGGSWMRCANYIPVLPNTEYKIHFTSGSGSQGSLIYLDGNKSVISYISSYISAVITTPSNCRYMVFYANSGWFGGNICINISKTTGSPKNGDYVPYNGHTYPLGSDTLRGYPMLINNKLAFDGDEKSPDGTTRRRYGIVDLGSLNWTYNSTAATPIFSTSLNSLPATCKSNSANMVCPKYEAKYNFWNTAGNDKCVASGSMNLNISDSNYNNAATFKTAMNGTYLVYPLATETTESSTSYQKIQTIDADGTESFTTSSPVPVGHYTQYPKDLWATLDKLADIFTPPTANGTYTLKVTVNNGVATYSWVAG